MVVFKMQHIIDRKSVSGKNILFIVAQIYLPLAVVLEEDLLCISYFSKPNYTLSTLKKKSGLCLKNTSNATSCTKPS